VLTGLVEYWNDGTAVPKELPKELWKRVSAVTIPYSETHRKLRSHGNELINALQWGTISNFFMVHVKTL
jgi:hypothetical protein